MKSAFDCRWTNSAWFFRKKKGIKRSNNKRKDWTSVQGWGQSYVVTMYNRNHGLSLIVAVGSLIVNYHGSNLFLIHTNIHYTSLAAAGSATTSWLYCASGFLGYYPLRFYLPFFGSLSSLSLDGDYHDVQTTKSMAPEKKKDTILTSCH